MKILILVSQALFRAPQKRRFLLVFSVDKALTSHYFSEATSEKLAHVMNNKCNVINNFYLKGQCHEMVVEVRPWSGSLALN
jgi:hypothetical protein